jgi:imidazolonepropionase-like amidohydrolase
MKAARTILAAAIACGMACAQQAIVLQNATIHTVTKGTFKGSVVIQNGLISEVGAQVLTPAGAKVIDASGKHIIPGIIDCHTHIALDSVNEGSVSVSSMVAMRDVVNPESVAIYHDLAGGTTTVNALHGSANPIGGLNVVLKMRWGKDADGLVMKEAKPGIKFALGENPKRQGQGGQSPFGGANLAARYPGTRMGVEDAIREAFTQARQYQAAWKDYDARKAKGESVLPPRKDLKLEPLVEILEGKRLVHAHCYRADEILMLLRVADEFGFKIATLQHVLEGYKVASEIKAHGAGASTFSDWWGYKIEAYDAIPYNAAVLTRKGVLTSLNSDDVGSGDLSTRLNTEAGKTMKYGGLNEDEALALITINPAKQLEIDRYVGSIEVGKQADLVVYDKDPLSIYSKVERVFIDGIQYFDREADVAARSRKDAEKKGLMEKEKAKEKASEKAPEKTVDKPGAKPGDKPGEKGATPQAGGSDE